MQRETFFKETSERICKNAIESKDPYIRKKFYSSVFQFLRELLSITEFESLTEKAELDPIYTPENWDVINNKEFALQADPNPIEELISKLDEIITEDKKKVVNNKPNLKKCLQCDVEFTTTSNVQKFCSIACRDESKKKN